MTTPADLPLRLNSELVTVAWLAAIPHIATLGGLALVDTDLPPDADAAGQPAPWTQTGFITVAVSGGNEDLYLPVSRPTMQIDCWATDPGSDVPPWDMAFDLASAIRDACHARPTRSREPLQVTKNGVAYPAAIVQGAAVVTSFRRTYADAADYARVTGDLWLSWKTAGQILT